MRKRRITGLYTLRRLRFARLLGLEKPQSGCSPFVRFSLRHILVACKRKSGVRRISNAFAFAIQQPKRRIQPER